MSAGLRVPHGVLIVALVAGCAPNADLPGEVTTRVYQTRSDVAADAIEIQVRNGSPTELTVLSARLNSPHLRSPATYDRPARIPAGATVDLKTDLPDPACDTAPDATEAAVDLEFEVDGRTGQATLVAPDSLGQLPAIAAEACLAEKVARLVSIRPPAKVSPGRDALSLTYRLAPTGDPGSVTFVDTAPTTLLSPATAAGRPVDAQRVGVRMTPTAQPRSLVLHYVPARCDAHAVAEDKQGTLLPLRVVVDSRRGSITLPVDSGLRSQIHHAVARICGLA